MLKDQIRQTLTGPTGQIPDKLAPLAAALGDMARPNSGLTWIRQPHVDRLLRSIAAGTIDLSHDAFDALPPSQTVEYIRALLIEHDALPTRDRYLAEFTAWSTRKLTLLKDPAHKSVTERFIRWHQLRRLREQIKTDGAVSSGLFLSAKQSTTVTVNFLNWLTDNEATLEDVNQAYVDRWLAHGPSTNALIETFLYWAIGRRLVPPLELPKRSLANRKSFGHDQRVDAIRRVLLSDEMLLNLRIAGGLVLLFGQPLNRIASMKLDHVQLDGDVTRLQIVDEWLDLPAPFDALMRSWLTTRFNLQTAAHTQSPWLFPGLMPGQHLIPAYISTALAREGIPGQLGRTAAWRDMVKDAPPSILAGLLGMTLETAVRHAELAGANFARCAALRQ
ncbi:hypothetical protein [Cryobacterium sp. M91]|uniref:hypothetical protein n=1 Tax=Cryobacterium sp. M91 TaxID=2048294 RepID=UPI000CE56BC2|nr:hypothetical protein [Cryobacterium sp. M91]